MHELSSDTPPKKGRHIDMAMEFASQFSSALAVTLTQIKKRWIR